MAPLNNFDRLLMGYLNDHPQAMYGEIATVLGASKIKVDYRIQELCREGYITINGDGAFSLTQIATEQYSLCYETYESCPSAEVFNWQELYIPMDFKN